MHHEPLREVRCRVPFRTNLAGLDVCKGSSGQVPIGFPPQGQHYCCRWQREGQKNNTALLFFFKFPGSQRPIGANSSCSPASQAISPQSAVCLLLPSGKSRHGFFWLGMQGVPKDDPNTHISNRRYLLLTITSRSLLFPPHC